jgi:hypothetical protein
MTAIPSVYSGGIGLPSPVQGAYLKGRNRSSDAERESFMNWYRRRQERKAAARAARLLVALNSLAGARPQAAPRAGKASLGTAAR